MEIDFDNEEEFDEICQNLDPDNTKLITFDAIYATYMEGQQEEQEDDPNEGLDEEAMLNDIHAS